MKKLNQKIKILNQKIKIRDNKNINNEIKELRKAKI